MFYIIETEEQLNKLQVYKDKTCFIEIIPYSDKVHPYLNQISLIYFRPLNAKKGFMICLDHTETLSLSLEYVYTFLSSLEAEFWTIDRKTMFHYGFKDRDIKGLKMAYAMSPGKEFPDIEECETYAHKFYNKKLIKRNDINRFIPVAKHYEKYEKLFKKLEFFPLLPNGFGYYNNHLLLRFAEIEQNGIHIDEKVFDEKYPNYEKQYNVEDGKIYTEYCFYNITARPTCSFNRINYVSLKKNDDSRKFITPANQLLIEFDYKSYQVKLMADHLGFKFSGNIHEQLAREYYDIPKEQEVSPEAYQAAKQRTFQIMYGRKKEYNGNVPFYKEVYQLRDNLWEKYQRDGYIVSPYSGRRLYNIDEITQILPFLMQCMETERNAIMLELIQKELQGRRTNLILYTYDAFLFDLDIDESKKLLQNIKESIETNDFQTSMKIGDNYSELDPFDPY